MKIIQANSVEDIAAVRRLFEEYAASLQIDLCFQNFSTELAGLPGAYASPRGRLLLALADGIPAGCVALRPHDNQAAEMKRLYVSPKRQGLGLGRKLAEAAIAEARAIGYTSMLLDTLPTMQKAIRLYESLGFERRPPYFNSPVDGNVFMELRLGKAEDRTKMSDCGC
ncbi:GNAT family N-acetyltransferase [Opitutus sp. GAS368]|uniref:GNAT family N-acetyltransferase n=1 Tax=Opitutus sp. GAS368 TaxID=1882749 RepID=UPI00087BB2F0|nr:GNAT family N-acetyltransferase [Opitutus sp. GAS368]SDS59193.1 Acetyltransferase (GNAT) family protein [Opitutus sp. GAS368]